MSPEPHIIKAATSKGGKGLVLQIEDQGIAPFPDIPEDGGDDGGRRRVVQPWRRRSSKVKGSWFAKSKPKRCHA
jgi:hypothetical protein